jgi:two-component system, response regulator YesN
MRKVLVVDDEPYMLEGWRTMVEWSTYGFELCAAVSGGEEALAAVESMQPDLVFTDIRMPGIDGLELIRTMREKLRSTSRIVIMSGYSEFDYVRMAMPYKIERYLLKPLIPEEIHSLLIELTTDASTRPMSACGSPKDENGTAAQYEGAVVRVIAYLQAHFRTSVRITDLAQVVGHHPVYLGQLFKKETGYSVREYIHRLRMAEAKRLLRQTDLKITVIADMLGYHDAEAFGEKFKAFTASSPSEYRTGARLY